MRVAVVAVARPLLPRNIVQHHVARLLVPPIVYGIAVVMQGVAGAMVCVSLLPGGGISIVIIITIINIVSFM